MCYEILCLLPPPPPLLHDLLISYSHIVRVHWFLRLLLPSQTVSNLQNVCCAFQWFGSGSSIAEKNNSVSMLVADRQDASILSDRDLSPRTATGSRHRRSRRLSVLVTVFAVVWWCLICCGGVWAALRTWGGAMDSNMGWSMFTAHRSRLTD